MKLIVPRIPGRVIVYAMKWTATLIAIICSSTLVVMATSASGQTILDRKISINIKDEGLKAALDKVARAATIKILYSGNIARSDAKVTLHVNSEKLSRVLERALTNLPYSFSAVDNDVLIRYDADKLKREQQERQNQQKKSVLPVSGKVTDNKGVPLIGATVRIKGTDKLTTTDIDGVFHLLDMDDSPVIVVSYIGYATKEVKLAGDLNNLIVVLEEDSAAIKEVVVSTGYQEVPLERATGSFSKVDNALYTRQVSTDVISRLKAIAPDLLFDERNGKTKLSIRGRSTIFANDQPLIVVDNFPYDGDITNVNPNDVESITILKDAAAASIWGVRAGNGVIVITTKKGRKNQVSQVELNANLTIGNKPDLFYKPQMTSADFVDVEKLLFSKGFYDADIANNINYPVLTPVIDLLTKSRTGAIQPATAMEQINAFKNYDVRHDIARYFYRKSVNQQYSLGFKGGGEKYTYYYSAGYDKNLNNLRNNGYDRLVLNAQQTFTPIKNLEIGTSIVYTQSNTTTNTAASDISMGNKSIYPYARLADGNGKPLVVARQYNADFVNAAAQKGLLNWSYVPINELSSNSNETKLSDTRFSGILKYTFIKGLAASINYQYERQNADNTQLQGEDGYYTRNLINSLSALNEDGSVSRVVPLGGIRIKGNTILSSQNGRGQLTYNTEWSKHQIAAIAGAEIRQATVTTDQSYLYGYDPAVGQGQPVDYADYFQTYPSGYYSAIPGNTAVIKTLDRFRSYFANGSYTYDSRYTISASGRIDQSNLFGVRANQRSVPLWSTGFKWSIDKEAFYQSKWLPQLSFRATYGYSGNYDNTVTAFTTAYYTTNFYSRQTAATLQSPPNTNLQWEKTAMLNLGIDFSSLNNTISGSIEYYRKKGTDLIGYASLDPTTGFTQYKGNVAGMKGSGWDLILNTKNINDKFRWLTSFSMSFVSDKITSYDLNNTNGVAYLNDASINSAVYNYSPLVGRPLFGIYAYKWAGLDPQTGDPMGLIGGQKSKDYSTLNNVLVDSLEYKGRALPNVYGAIRNTFYYGQVSVSFNISYRLGYYFRRNSVNYSELFYSNVSHSDYAKRWQKPGDEAHTNVPSLIYPDNQSRDIFYTRSAALIDKGDNIRLQDISFSYDLSPKLCNKLHLNRLQVYSYMNNVGLLWTANKNHIDPDYPNIPLPRTIAFGIKAGF